MRLTNPLDEFQSHSIHYVMLACRSTQDVVDFTVDSPQAQSATLSAIDNVAKIGDKVHYGKAAGVYLMIDTRRFSQFTVEDFELETMMSGFTVPGSKSPNSTAINLKFTILDSMGISFANFLQYIMDQKLQVSFDGMTLLMRVLFIGHRADGTSSTVQSISIPAFFNTIQMDLNDTKGIYHCTLFPMIGMTSNSNHNAKWTNIGAASSYFTGPSANTLGAVVASFERRLNEESIDKYPKKAGTNSGGQFKDLGAFGRPVQYMITIPKEWEQFPFSGPSQGGTIETVFKKIEADKAADKAKKEKEQKSAAKESHLAVNPSLTITEVLDVIFKQTLGVAELGNFTRKADADKNIKFYKHLISVTSDDDGFTVHVDVVLFVVPNVDLAAKSNHISDQDEQLYTQEKMPNGAMRRVPRQCVELDYIFSGTNLDVLSLDLKIENLNILLMQGSKLGQGELYKAADKGQAQDDGDGDAEEVTPVFGRRSKDPALIPARSALDSSNYANTAANASSSTDASPQDVNQQYLRNLSAFYNAGPIEAKLSLRGNPDLMASVALQTIPTHVSAITVSAQGASKVNNDVKQQYRKDFETNLLKTAGSIVTTPGRPVNSLLLSGPNFVSGPVFVKVNVYGPNVDFVSGEYVGVDKTQLVFGEDNYYFLDKIISKIDGARFTQELSLRSFSVYNFPNTSAKGSATKTTKDI